jgi:hypothetical protein
MNADTNTDTNTDMNIESENEKISESSPILLSSTSGDITIKITAVVSIVQDHADTLDGAIEVNDTIWGYYTYNASTIDSKNLTTVGDYWHYTAPYGIKIFAGGFIFQTNASDVNFLVEIVNNHTGSDNYLLRSYNNSYISNGAYVDHISWQLDDDNMTALDSDALPTTPPVLEDWDSIFGLTITGWIPDPAKPDWSPNYETDYFIRAHVTSAVFYDPADSVSDIDDYIQGLPDDAFKNNPSNRKNTFHNKLDSVQGMIDSGEYSSAINKLQNDIRAKCDGACGGNPNNDWITDSDAQIVLCAMIDDLIAYLETLV